MKDTRGQAYTLEGVIGALVILSAVLFAMQSVVLTPGSGGSVDVADRENVRQQAQDVLTISSQNDTFDLSAMARYWSESEQTFYGGFNSRVGYGSRTPPGTLGSMLNETFGTRAHQYNVELRYRPEEPDGETQSVPVVFRGSPDRNAVTVSQTIVLYDNQTLTSPEGGTIELWQYGTSPTGDEDDGYYPVPDAIDGPIYNVVEVRLTVW